MYLLAFISYAVLTGESRYPEMHLPQRILLNDECCKRSKCFVLRCSYAKYFWTPAFAGENEKERIEQFRITTPY